MFYFIIKHNKNNKNNKNNKIIKIIKIIKIMENDYVKLKDVGTKVDIRDVQFTICCSIL